MPSVNIRKQGGAAVITIPAEVLKQLDLGIGETLRLEVNGGALIARPQRQAARRRYSLAELLEGITPSQARSMRKATSEFHAGPPVGRELP